MSEHLMLRRPTLIAAGLVLGALLLVQTTHGKDRQKTETSAAVTAEEMMIRAHEARAEWKNFPGFEAEIIVSHNGKQTTGNVNVTGDGEVRLILPDKPTTTWVQRSLESLVAHRQSSEGREYNVEFADDVTTHPLGRLIKLNEDLMGSKYRIKDDVITEVHRTMKSIRFTITVTEVTRNKEGKYLPRCYSFSTWDVKTGNLKSNTVAHQQWKRVGSFDLPKRLVWVKTSDDGKRGVRQIDFRKLRLLTSSTTGGK